MSKSTNYNSSRYSVCITSIVRVIAVSSISLSDGSWVNTYPAIWAFVETSIAVVSACLPTLRPIYKYAIYGKNGLSHGSKESSGRQSGDTDGIGLTKSTSPWYKSIASKKSNFDTLESGGASENEIATPTVM